MDLPVRDVLGGLGGQPAPVPATLAAAVEELTTAATVLRQVLTLAEQARTISDAQFRARLLTLAECAR